MGDNVRLAVSSRSVRQPWSFATRRSRPRIKNPAPERRIKAIATSATTNPCGNSRKLKVGEIGACDEQHAPGEPHRKPREQACSRVLGGSHERDNQQTGLRIRRRKISGETDSDRTHLRLCLSQSDGRTESP